MKQAAKNILAPEQCLGVWFRLYNGRHGDWKWMTVCCDSFGDMRSLSRDLFPPELPVLFFLHCHINILTTYPQISLPAQHGVVCRLHSRMVIPPRPRHQTDPSICPSRVHITSQTTATRKGLAAVPSTLPICIRSCRPIIPILQLPGGCTGNGSQLL